MRKFLLLFIAILAVALTTSVTYAYTFIHHDNVIATDSPYAITYTTTEFDEDYTFVHIKIAPSAGYNFLGSTVINLVNIFDDERLGSYTLLYQDGFIGEFPTQIPNYVSAARVQHFSQTHQVKQTLGIAHYPGDPSMVVLRFAQAALSYDYYVVTVMLSNDYDPATYVSSLLPDSSEKPIRISSITQEQFDEIYQQGYDAAIADYGVNYDALIQEIIDLEAYIASLEVQLEVSPVESSNPAYGTVDFIEDNLIWFILIAGVILFIGLKLGSTKSKRYKSYKRYR